jgi:hypothetical protein
MNDCAPAREARAAVRADTRMVTHRCASITWRSGESRCRRSCPAPAALHGAPVSTAATPGRPAPALLARRDRRKKKSHRACGGWLANTGRVLRRRSMGGVLRSFRGGRLTDRLGYCAAPRRAGRALADPPRGDSAVAGGDRHGMTENWKPCSGWGARRRYRLDAQDRRKVSACQPFRELFLGKLLQQRITPGTRPSDSTPAQRAPARSGAADQAVHANYCLAGHKT